MTQRPTKDTVTLPKLRRSQLPTTQLSSNRLVRTGGDTTDNKDPHHSSPHSSPPPTETDPSKIASDAPPEGYKTFDIRVEWAEYVPHEVIQRKHVFTSHPDQDTRPEFAKAWLAFDGFSSKSARGPQTPNLFRTREKWRKLAPPASAYKDEDHSSRGSITFVPRD
ncbi:hypothetical protein F5888DRAFT_1809133 [Russula emetica]|nr:hypothetical protein F5888DRAFT_1809133 [Russula emetica]